MSEFDELYEQVMAGAAPKEAEPVIPSKYDSPLKAGLAGGARAVSFGLSDPLLRYGLNVHPETLEGLKEANPKASLAGEIGGIGLSLASGAGAPAGIAKLGNLARGATAAKNAGLLARLGAHATGGVIEGGLYGLSQYISDTGLDENPDLSAEKFMASIAGGALTGGALGGGTGLLNEGLEAAKKAIPSKMSGLTLREGLKKLAAKGAVRNVAQAGDYAKGKLDDADQIGEFLLGKAKFSERADAYAMADKFAAVKKEIGDERIGKILAMADEAPAPVAEEVADTAITGGTRSMRPPGPKGFDVGPAVKRGRALVDELRNSPASQDIVKSFDELLDRYTEQQAKAPLKFREVFAEQSRLNKNLPDGPLKQQQELIYQWKEILKEELRDQAEALVPESAAAMKSAMRDYRSAAELEKLAGKASERLEAKSPFSPAYWVQRYGGNLSAHVLNELADSAVVKAMSNGLKKSVDGLLEASPIWGGTFRGELELASARGAQSLLDTHIKLAESDPNYLAAVGYVDEPPATLKDLAARGSQLEAAAGVLKAQDEQREKAFNAFLSGKPPRPDKKQLSLKGYNSLAEIYKAAVSNPEVLVGLSSPQELMNLVPDLAPQISAVGARAANYLYANMPQPPGLEPLKALDRGWVPSDLQLNRWARCIKAVQDPNSVIAGLADGSATKEGIHALKTVYPELFVDSQQAIMERLATHEELLNQQQRAMLAQFLERPTGGQGDPSMLILSQNLYNNQKMKQPKGMKSDGRQNVSQEDNAQTQAQRIEGR